MWHLCNSCHLTSVDCLDTWTSQNLTNNNPNLIEHFTSLSLFQSFNCGTMLCLPPISLILLVRIWRNIYSYTKKSEVTPACIWTAETLVQMSKKKKTSWGRMWDYQHRSDVRDQLFKVGQKCNLERLQQTSKTLTNLLKPTPKAPSNSWEKCWCNCRDKCTKTDVVSPPAKPKK